MFLLSKNSRIRHDNIMKKQYEDYLVIKDTCMACKYYCWRSCDLEYPKNYHNETNKCPRYDIKKGYKRAIKYIKKQENKNKKRSGLSYDKNKID